ncbi:glycosyltransferase family 4 protein [Vibrio sp.]|nr:glycosyltransferase family 4 protein [Vibrio sp.]
MKILYHHRIASKDGQYVHVEEIINALKAQGHEIILVAPEMTKNASFGSDGGWMSKLRSSLPKAISELLEFCYSFLSFYQLCRAIIEHKPDCIYERYNLYLPSGIWAKKLFKKTLLLEVNSPLYDERKKYGGVSLDWLAKWSEYYVWRNADHVLPVTEVLSKFIQNAGVDKEKITVIPNGIDLTRFNSLPKNDRLAQFKDKLVIGFVGFCREWHHLDKIMALIASQNNDNIMFLVVGDGPVSDSLKQQAKALNMQDNFHITGLVERDDMPFWLEQIDIALQPAVTPWASPLKMIEYMATGKAIIAPNTDNIRELLSHNSNAVLFDNDEEVLSNLNNLIQDEQLRTRLKQAAIDSIERQGLTWQHNAERIVSLFQNNAKG